jgi:hypothetical protein
MAEGVVTFEMVWERVVSHTGEFFKTATGRWFTYRLDGDRILPSHTEIRIPRSDLELAYSMVPIPQSAKLNRLVEGPSYVWAILHDERITRGDW